MPVTLRPLRDDEFGAWLEAHVRGYAVGMAASASMSMDAARAKASADMRHVLPDGLATAGASIWAIETEGRGLGSIFFGIRGGDAWLYDITVEEAERGKGYGRAAMLAFEDEVRRLGHGTLALNVWGGNAVARSLYRSLGFVETSVHMAKEL